MVVIPMNWRCKIMGKENIKGTVIIVEDDMIISLVVGIIVEKLGFKVVANADNGVDAVNKIKEHKPDVVVMDMSLNGKLDGIETVNRIRSFSNVPVIYISGHSDQQHISRAKETGFVDYLVKPVSRDEMILSMEKAIKKDGEYYFNQAS